MWEMQKISYKKALKAFKNGYMVFVLYNDGSDAAVVTLEEIEHHNSCGGKFGIKYRRI